jgi:long-chain-fatty-acid--CoA ligase ACSBG
LVSESFEFCEDDRIVSYLPSSHIAGFGFDVMMQLHCGLCVYYARPDALQGTLVQTLQWAKPTAFLGVPRIWEKFEEKLKSIAAEKGGLAQSISKWAKGLGYANTQAKIKHQSAPFCYSLANFLILKRIKQA